MRMKALVDLANGVKAGQEFDADGGEYRACLALNLAVDASKPVAPKPVAPKPVAAAPVMPSPPPATHAKVMVAETPKPVAAPPVHDTVPTPATPGEHVLHAAQQRKVVPGSKSATAPDEAETEEEARRRRYGRKDLRATE